MKSNQIMFYNTTVNEALEMFEMESRRDDYGYVNMDKVKVKINKKGDHVLITLDKYDFNVDLEDSIIELKMAFPGKFRDLDSIERVQAVLSLQPKNNWWKEILEGLQLGEPLHYRVEEILEELEERIENPDQEIKEKLEQAIASNPRNNLLRSFQDQFLAGRELSDRQMEILEGNLPRQVYRPSLAVNVDQRQLDRVNEALSLNSRDRFVQQMKQKVEQGIRLSPKQMAVVENSILASKSPAARLLNDLRGNVSLSKEDFKTIMKGINRGIDTLNEEERKRIRHLIYRNQRRLDNSYSKEEIRTLLKKGSLMRRSASEIIRNLEMRVARLEKQARPTMSPRRLIDEGLFESEDYNPEGLFEAFELNEKSILKFVKSNRKLMRYIRDWDDYKLVHVSVMGLSPRLAEVHVHVVSTQPSFLPDDIHTSSSFDLTVTSSGKVTHILRAEESDLTLSQYNRIKDRPTSVSIDEESLQSSFKGYRFNR